MLSNLEKELINLGLWSSDKIKYHLKANRLDIIRKQINFGEVWECDLGYNIGQEKNKKRPVLVVSNNHINQGGKVVVVCITDAKGKINLHDLPQEKTWYLLYSNTNEQDKMFKPHRKIPNNQRQYYFLKKDSVLQCEELRIVSKSRFDFEKGLLGRLDPIDLSIIRNKLYKVFS